MAEGVVKSDPTSGEIEFPCSPCNRKNKWNNAVKYCEGCDDNMCEECIQNHNSFPSISGHTMTSHLRVFKMCKKHLGKKLDMFCEKDGIVGCKECMKLQHG